MGAAAYIGVSKLITQHAVVLAFRVTAIRVKDWFYNGCPRDSMLNVAKWILENVKDYDLKPSQEGLALLRRAAEATESGQDVKVTPISFGENTVSEDSFSEDQEDTQEVVAKFLAETESSLEDTTLEGSLKRTMLLEADIFRRVRKCNDPKLLAAYKQICSLRMEQVEKVSELARIRDSLVKIEDVVNAAQTTVSIVLNEIRALPEAAARRVNPTNPALAKEELESVIKALVVSANKQVESQLKTIWDHKPKEGEK